MNSTIEGKSFSGSEHKGLAKAGRGPQIFWLSVAFALTVATVASAQTYRVLKNFTEGSDGYEPGARLVLAGSTLYGTTGYGGASDNGLVFKMNTDGSGYAVLKSFTGSDGSRPWAGLVLAGSTFYGTTEYGGSSYHPPDYGGGVVFKVNTDGSGYAVLKSFTGSDGMNPSADLVLAGGTLYGTTVQGGIGFNPRWNYFGYGVVFKVNTDGSGYAVLKSFTGSDGSAPCAGLVLAGSTLFGTTQQGGGSSNGVVFKVNTDGSGYAVLKGFTGSDGAGPLAGLVLADSTLYGTTSGGGIGYNPSPNNWNWGYGVVFKVNTDGSGDAVLKSFTGSDGMDPEGGLVLAGSTLYGTTGGGGSWYNSPDNSSGYGVVFKVSTDGSGYEVLKNFTRSDGMLPRAGLVLAGSTLFGTTFYGGDLGQGVVFSLECLSITKQPTLAQTAEAGTTVTFEVDADSLAPGLACQWFFDGTNVLVGATNAFLELTDVQPGQAGAYTVVVTNLVGAVTSTPALLSVIPPVDSRVVGALHLTGGTGSLLHLEYADSLAAPQWVSLSNVTLSGGPQIYGDLYQPLSAQRFYRAWQTNGPQPPLGASIATEIRLTGTEGEKIRIDYINQFGPVDAWVTLDTVTLTNTTQLYYDFTALGRATRLYRLVPVP